MRLVRPWIAVVIMVAVARADGTDGTGGKRMEPVKSAMDAPALTARIDAVLAARWAESNIRPVPIADDGEFLRRVSLDLIGKIPTAAEARDFLDDPSKGSVSHSSSGCSTARPTPPVPRKSGDSSSCPRPIRKTWPGPSRANSRRGCGRR